MKRFLPLVLVFALTVVLYGQDVQRFLGAESFSIQIQGGPDSVLNSSNQPIPGVTVNNPQPVQGILSGDSNGGNGGGGGGGGSPACGDGTVDPGEQCDDGNSDNTDTCDTNCMEIHPVSAEATFRILPNLRAAHPQGGGANNSTLVTIYVKNAGTPDIVSTITEARTNDDGMGFVILPNGGPYDLFVDGLSYLRRIFRDQTVQAGVMLDLAALPNSTMLFGDVGTPRDGRVTISDVTAITGPIIASNGITPRYSRQNFRTGTETVTANEKALEKVDANGDGAVSVTDITAAITPLVNGTQGDR